MGPDDWIYVEDSGSTRSPSIVNSASTSPGFSYAGSIAGSPNDVGYVSQDSAGPAAFDSMHDIAATGQHGAYGVAPVSWDMGNPLSPNEMIALQNDFFETLDEMQFDMAQAQEFNFNTMPDIPNSPTNMMRCNVNPSSDA